jgi:hypothetical protein
VRPSPPLLRHAAHCYNHSDAVEHARTGRRHACYCTSYGTSSTAPSSPPEGAPVQAQGTPLLQDDRQLHGTVRHTTTRSKIVRHACKSPSPWPIKGRRSPSPRGGGAWDGTTIEIAHTLSVFSTILALASITSLGTWRPRLLFRLACSHPSTGTPVQSNTVPRAHRCWTYGPGWNQDKPGVFSCLAATIERQISALITSYCRDYFPHRQLVRQVGVLAL